ncbi:MAG: NADH-quinone oxidoreductase subunit M [Cyclobacteriaceae bacterium]|nr:NADH-quinone oxidoreductase subunit M [Cyclobacteriaceae bacterium]MCB0500608.1 NADH-quinone oxidoreductase subunit M [Cyclobacteriaceae bacterium]MCB9237437.1 NADH-quinone oxidoreductase subunit M [Flammeovirgaceae bacterium]MCW5903736.1 NADH-quinone oxidoreductase subunit M [Cyclobacteriaceae bacterium]
MILPGFIITLMLGGILSWIAARWGHLYARWISLLTLFANFIVAITVWVGNAGNADFFSNWALEFSVAWIPSFGINFHLALDGLSLLLLSLTFFLGTLAVLVSWKEIQEKTGLYHFCLLWVLAGITGVFLTMDLFLFYFFWEVMLIPMFFLILIWGHENRRYAAFKFFIFTQASGLLMLLSILGFYFIHGAQTGIYTFDYFEWLGTELPPQTAMWLMLGFLIAFVVKLPVVPFHAWLPDAHSEAPTAGSLVLAALMLKTGAYGLLRFILPLFHHAAMEIAPWAMAIGVVGAVYGALLAFSQTNLKRLVAYTSVSHMGFIMLGVFSFHEIALQGVVMQIMAHGISTGALFILAGMVYERIHTRDITQMGGFWKGMPFLGVMALVFTMATWGLPGLGNFVAEFLTLVGTWQVAPITTAIAAIGLVAATAYALRILQKVFYGPAPSGPNTLSDLTWREKIIMGTLVAAISWLGLYPQPVLDTSYGAVNTILHENNETGALREPYKKQEGIFTSIGKGGAHE